MKAAITILNQGYDYADEIKKLAQIGVEGRYIPLEGTDDVEKIIDTLRGYDIVLAGSELWRREVFESLKPGLKMVARLGTGVDRMDVAAATKLGIPVSNAPGANACSVAQHTLALMLSLLNSVVFYDRTLQNGLPVMRKMADDLSGRTVGLVGFGKISRELAKLLRGFECRIVAFDVFRDELAAEKLMVKYVELDELVKTSDIISLHVPLNNGTLGMVDSVFLNRMKRNAFLINTSRSGVIRQPDLIYALKNGVIAGVGLDVYDPDSLNDLLKLDNVVVTPYVAFSSKKGNRNVLNAAIKSIEEFVNNKSISNLLNPDYR